MESLSRVKWRANFDMENLVGLILQNGMLLSVGLVMIGLFLQWGINGSFNFQEPLHGDNILSFVRTDIHRAATQKTFSTLLIHLGIAVLILTPYVRLLVSFFYFAYVERDWRYAFFSSLVVVPLTYFLLFG